MAVSLGHQLRALAGLCLLVGAVCHKDQAKSNRLRALLPFSRFNPPYNVCTSDWAPIAMCVDIEDPADFSGYQIALWLELAKDMGWADSDWTLTCMDWTEMIEDLVNPAGSCSFAAAGVEVSLPNIVLGLKFSWPIYKSGFQVLIASAVEAGGTWAFAEAFHVSVWIMLGATAIIVSILVTAVELMTFGNRANYKGVRGWSWYATGKIVQVPTHVGDPKTWASRVLVLGYAFLVLIMVHLFTATTANKMTMQRLANDITSKADLPGKKIESWKPYVPLLRDNDDDTAVMLNNLRRHTYQALVLDSPVVQHFAAEAEHCDLYPVGDPFETFNLAIAFPPDAPDELAGNISASIVRLQDNFYVKGESVNTFTSWRRPEIGRQSCSNAFGDSSNAGHGTGSQILLKQVAGLWYIQAITAGIASFIVLAHRAKQAVALLRGQPVQWDKADKQLPIHGSADTKGDKEVATAAMHNSSHSTSSSGESLGMGVSDDCVAQVSLPSGCTKQQRLRRAPLLSMGTGSPQQQLQQFVAPPSSSELSILTARRVDVVLSETNQLQQQELDDADAVLTL